MFRLQRNNTEMVLAGELETDCTRYCTNLVGDWVGYVEETVFDVHVSHAR